MPGARLSPSANPPARIRAPRRCRSPSAGRARDSGRDRRSPRSARTSSAGPLVSAMTHTPASGPFGPVTTPPRSSLVDLARAPRCRLLRTRRASIDRARSRPQRRPPDPDPKYSLSYFMTRSPVDSAALYPNIVRTTNHTFAGPLRQAAHVPREPVLAVADQDAERPALAREPQLLAAAGCRTASRTRRRTPAPCCCAM